MTYAGDNQLQQLLRDNGLDHDVAEIRALIEGIIAAPAPRSPSDWLSLVHPDLTGALSEQVQALRTQLASRNGAARWSGQRLIDVRAHMAELGVDGFFVPRADEHQNEYVPARAERLEWVSGFSGSAGAAIVLRETAAIFVDGRYTLQVRDQVDLDAFSIHHLIEEPPHKWLAGQLAEGQVMGYDPWLHTVDGAKRLKTACKEAGATLKPCETNPLDAAWTDQPAAPISAVIPHPVEFSGRSSSEKRADLAGELDGDAVVLTTPDAIAWLLNIRGGDVPCTPLPLSFAVLHADGGVDLCIDPRKLLPETRAHLGDDVRLHAAGALGGLLDAFDGKAVQLDAGKAADWIQVRLKAAGAKVVHKGDPCALPKACKNAVELEGTRAAHRRDGAALTRFLAWIDANAPAPGITELSAVAKLRDFRDQDETLRDLSFDTISGSGPNGAIVHYRVTEATDRPIEGGTLYLVDSGGQYPDGTTDVTRTVAIGTPTEEMRDRFTRVLKGHIGLGTARFCPGTTGAQLDALARLPLWQVGLDYDHGTGHGVGSYLGVHEGPHRISKAPSSVALKPGMIVSNEPGYYKTDAYGIRIENLVVVVQDKVAGGDREMLAFETLTMAPLDRSLIDASLLTDAELDWVNGYHNTVRTTLTPLLDAETVGWLNAATAPIER